MTDKIEIKEVDIHSEKFKEGFKNFCHVQAVHALEGDVSDEYENHILLLQATHQISGEDARKTLKKYILTGEKII